MIFTAFCCHFYLKKQHFTSSFKEVHFGVCETFLQKKVYENYCFKYLCAETFGQIKYWQGVEAVRRRTAADILLLLWKLKTEVNLFEML